MGKETKTKQCHSTKKKEKNFTQLKTKNHMKNIKILLVLFSIGIWLASCSSEENNQNMPSNEATESYEQLAQELAAYNAAFYEEYNIPQTKGKFLKKLLKVIGADAIGAAVGLIGGPEGSLVLGIGASIGAAASSSTNSIIPTESLTRSERFITTEGVGYMHNLIISNIEKENPGIYNQPLSNEKIAELLSHKFKNMNIPISDEVIKTNLSQVTQITPHSEFESIEELMQYYQSILPEHSSVVNVLEDFIEHIDPIIDNTEAIKSYYEGYKETIKTSTSILYQDMEKMLVAIDVAANSAVLWNIQE